MPTPYELLALPIPNGFSAGGKPMASLVLRLRRPQDAPKDIPGPLRDLTRHIKERKIRFEVTQEGGGAAVEPDLAGLDPEFWRRHIEGLRVMGQEPTAPVKWTLSYSMAQAVHRHRFDRTKSSLAALGLPEAGVSLVQEVDGNAEKMFHGLAQRPAAFAGWREVAVDLAGTTIEAFVENILKAPSLARRCGLILDVALPFAVPVVAGEGSLRCSVTVDRSLVGLAAPTVLVAYELDIAKQHFQPRPRKGQPGKAQRVIPFGGVLRARAAGGQVHIEAVAEDTIGSLFKREQQTEMPRPIAQRTTGLSLVMRDAKLFEEEAIAAPGGGAIEPLYAEDLMVGFRVDVKRGKGRFQSLCKADLTYRDWRSGKPLHLDPAQELYVQPARTREMESFNRKAGTASVSDGAFVHEVVAHYSGWSLVTPRPGRSGGLERDDRGGAHPAEQSPFKVEARTPPASVVPWRVGHTYQFRLRPVFHGGLGISQVAADLATNDEGHTAPVTATRAEPVGVPTVAIVGTEGPGDSLLVQHVHEERTASVRAILPPPVSREMAEFLGVLDGIPAARARRLLAEVLDREPAPTCPGRYLPDPWVDEIEVTVQLATRCSELLGPATPGPEGTQWGYQACGPTAHTFRVKVAGEEWPDVRPFEIASYALPEGPSRFNAPPRDAVAPPGFRLKLKVAPGDQFKVTLRSYPRAAVRSLFQDVEILRTADKWLSATNLGATLGLALDPQQEQTAAELASLAVMASERLKGELTAVLAPEVVLSATHATARPSAAAAFAAPRVERGRDEAKAALLDTLVVDGATTEKVSIEYSWRDFNDRVTSGPGYWIPGRGTSGSFTCDPVDTRLLLHQAEAPAPIKGGPKGQPVKGKLVEGAALTFPDTRARRCAIQTLSKSRFQHQFPHLSEKEFLVASHPREVIVPASARPPVPNVMYALPIFPWEQSSGPSTFASTRKGGHFRVCLERPWFESGEGEMLGLVLWPAGVSNLKQKQVALLQPFVTQWGAEVLLRGKDLPEGPYLQHFPHADVRLSGMALAGLRPHAADLGLGSDSDPRVDVVGFKAAWDERGYWYADIQMESGAAFAPWVRLACVRLQPNAISGCHLSDVSAVTLVQLAPTRVMSLARTTGDPSLVRVTLAGSVPEDGDTMGTRATVRLLKRSACGSNGVYAPESGAPVPLQRDQCDTPLRREQKASSAYRGAIRVPEDAGDWVLEVRESMGEIGPDRAEWDLALAHARPVFVELAALDSF